MLLGLFLADDRAEKPLLLVGERMPLRGVVVEHSPSLVRRDVGMLGGLVVRHQ